ncbi:MAG: hypothetical protein HS113_01780 [Verrucomicrobiales bacterium]|nr:hypothetical protein [Verrucomicrobiales bacterium]
MKGEHSICWRRATWGALLLLALVRVQAQLPVVAGDVQTTVHQRVDYGCCPGIVVGLMNTNGSPYTTELMCEFLASHEPTLRRVNGAAHLDLAGDTDRDYVLQASADLSHWVDLSTNMIWDGPIPDPESAAVNHRFYRVLEP